MLGVLRPGGVLYLTTPNVVDLRGRAQAVLGRSPQSHLFGIGRTLRMNEWVHRREYAADEVGRLLEAVGFRVGDQPGRRDGGRRPRCRRVARAAAEPATGAGGTVFAAATRAAVPASETDRARIAPDRRYVEAAPGSSPA